MAEQVGSRFHRGVVLYGGSEVIPFASNIHAMPVSALWLAGSEAMPSRKTGRRSR
jgi:hypothetical protein